MAYGEKMARLSPCSDEYIAKMLSPLLPSSGSLLDVACGRGERLGYLAETFPNIKLWGIDSDRGNLGIARSICPSAEILEADAAELPFVSGNFDLVLCECAFSLFADSLVCAEEIMRVLRPSGMLLLGDLYAGLPEKAIQFHGCNTVNALYARNYIEDIFCRAGFRVAAYYDRSRDLGSMVAQMYMDGCLYEYIDEDRLRLMREAKAGYGLWLFKK